MIRKALLLATALALISCDEKRDVKTLPQGDAMNPTTWEVGPWIDRKTSSLNVPRHPVRHPEGLAIEFPHPNAEAGHVHYVTRSMGDLAGKSSIRLKYEIETADGVRLAPPSSPDGPAMLTLFLQRCGDNWSGRGDYESYRWYASFATVTPLEAGALQISVAV